MGKLITPVQALVLTGTGTKPTVPTPSTITPMDSRFNAATDIMVGQFAYNVDDDVWYYRHSTGIKPLGGGEITVNDVEVWRSDKTYRAGNTFVSYVNVNSTDPSFQTEAIYRCTVNTVAGESPESAQSKWEAQGTSVNFDNIDASNVIYDNTVSTLAADRVQGAIDELASSIASGSSTGNNLGTGEGVYAGNNLSVLNFKSLVDGQGITLTSDANEIEISTNADANLATNLGDTEPDTYGVFKQLTAGTNAIELKSLTQGGNITLSESVDGNRIVIDGPNVPVKTVANIVITDPTPNGKGGVFHSLSPSGLLNLRQLVGGDNVNVVVDENIDAIIISATGEANTCSSLGTPADGYEICDGKVGVNINFKRIQAGNDITIDDSNPNRLTINSDGPVRGAENLNSGVVFKQLEPTTKLLQFRNIVGGTNVSVIQSDDDIVVSASSVGDENAAVNVFDSAGAEGIATGQLDARAIELRSLRGQGPITVSQSVGGNEVLIDSSAKDNVEEYADFASFPVTGVSGIIYIDQAENATYRWDGSQYVQIGGGGGASERENTTTNVTADAQTTTVDFSLVGVKTLNVSDLVTTHTLAVSNMSTTERYNTIVIDNSSNTSGLTVTFNDQTGTITYRGAKNDFPGTYPTMNVVAGSIWEVSFENRSATVTTINFDEIENYA